jgi:TetR/AcrR family transcriptional regulator
LRELTDNKAEVILQWSKTGKIAKLNPHHLIFSIWATTQHYADFDVQVKAVLNSNSNDHFEQAFEFLDNMYRATLSPN